MVTEQDYEAHTRRFNRDACDHSIDSFGDVVAEDIVSNDSPTQNRPARVRS